MPLTQALASQVERGGLAPAPLTPPPFRHLPVTWDEVNAGRGEPTAVAFLFLVRELADLTSKLQANPVPAPVNHRIFLPQRVPGPARLARALREAQESLRDLKGLLSCL